MNASTPAMDDVRGDSTTDVIALVDAGSRIDIRRCITAKTAYSLTVDPCKLAFVQLYNFNEIRRPSNSKFDYARHATKSELQLRCLLRNTQILSCDTQREPFNNGPASAGPQDKIGTIQRRLALPLHKDDKLERERWFFGTKYFCCFCHGHQPHMHV